PSGDKGSRVGIDDVVWPTAFEPEILQLVIDVPAVVFQHKLNPVHGQVPVHSCCICLGNGQFLVASKAHHTVTHITPARKFRMLLHTNPTRERGECLGTRAGALEDMCDLRARYTPDYKLKALSRACPVDVWHYERGHRWTRRATHGSEAQGDVIANRLCPNPWPIF